MRTNSDGNELSSKNDPRPHFLGALVGAVLLALAGSIFLAAGRVDRALARTQESAITGAYAEAEDAFETAEWYLRYASWIPAVERRLNDVQARRASMQYWRRAYDRIVPPDVDPLAGIPADNVALQLITANAVYRKSQPGAKDRANALRALDAAINAYVAVLRNSGADEAAAYNYEYLVRAREDIDKGRRPADLTEKAEDGPAGEQGGLPPAENKQDLKILIPLDPAEMDKAIEPGKGAPLERKG